ncbi:MAG: DUF748 domain-containing protein [Verrucomicrobia bacterium]|nr:DUF748 domain-containing protein [Verrucomicrobiota bacterium]
MKFNPWTLSLTIRGLALNEADGHPFASWEELYVNFQASSLFRWAWTFKEIRLDRPFLEVLLAPDGQLNLANLVAPAEPAPPTPPAPAAIPRLGIWHLTITNGFVAFEDQTLRQPFRTEYQPINLRLTEFTTRPDTDSPYAFHAEGDTGSQVRWAGNLTVQPLRSSGQLAISGVPLRRYQPYLDQFTRAHLTNGVLRVRCRLPLRGRYQRRRLRRHQLRVPHGQPHPRRPRHAGDRLFPRELRHQRRRPRSPPANGPARHRRGLRRHRPRPPGSRRPVEPPRPPQPRAHQRARGTDGLARHQHHRRTRAPWTVNIDAFKLDQTRVTFADHTRRSPFQTTLEPIEFSVDGFSTKPGTDARYTFSFTTEAAEKLSGSGAFSLDPIRSSGEVLLAALTLPKYLPYAEDAFRGRLTAGQLEVRVPYQLALAPDQLHAGVSNLAVRLTGLELQTPDPAETVLKVGAVTLDGVTASLPEQRAQVGQVRSQDATLLVRRKPDGSLNWFDLLPAGALLGSAAEPTSPGSPGPSREPVVQTSSEPVVQASSLPPGGSGRPGMAAEAEEASSAPPWDIAVGEFALENYAVAVEDQQPAKPASFTLDQVALNVQGFRTTSNPPVSVRLHLRSNESGTLDVQGTAQLDPPAGEFALGLTNIDLRSLQSYVQEHVRLGIVSGAFATTTKVRFETDAPGALQLAFTGDVQITNFATTDLVAFKDLVRWDELALTGIDFSLEPARLKLATILWRGLAAQLLRAPDGQLNLLSLSAAPAPASETAAEPSTPSPAPPAKEAAAGTFPIQIDTFQLENASFAFTDLSLEPAVQVGLHELTGTVKGLSSALNTTAEVDLAGKVDEQAPFAVKGRINPLAAERLVDLEITNRNTQLTAFTPYTEKYLGHALNKGRLTLGLHYQVQGDQLQAANRFLIDGLMLGPRNQSPDATSLPVKLGVALLKDRNGLIDLDVPIAGRLDDPEFRIGSAVLKVIANLIVKTALSPFSLLGKLAGGGEELSFLDFEPGTTNLVEGELSKLDKLAKALTERPAVNLEIEGSVDRTRDRDALALAKLESQLKTRYLRERSARGRPAPPLESLELEPEEAERLLRAEFVERFGTNLTAILQTNALAQARAATSAPEDQTRPEPRPEAKPKPKAKRGFLGLGLFGGGRPKPSPIEKRLGKADRAALDELTPELMESLLARHIEVTEDEFRALMAARARWVQDQLLRSGAVTTDRLFLTAPKPTGPAAAGQSRVNLSLN